MTINLKKLHLLFKTKNNIQLFIVFIVFAVSGSLSVIVSEPILRILNFKEYIESKVLEIIFRILIIFPLYQLILIIVGTIFGQFNYFWSFQKKFLKKFTANKS